MPKLKIPAIEIVKEAEQTFRDIVINEMRDSASRQIKDLVRSGWHESSDDEDLWIDDMDELYKTILLQEAMKRIRSVTREEFDAMDHHQRMNTAKSNTFIM